jgi:hypothetical protein
MGRIHINVGISKWKGQIDPFRGRYRPTVWLLCAAPGHWPRVGEYTSPLVARTEANWS